nr:hypothetical protein [Tanacetum cinerariifolium]GEX80102.1 hypothetical protein [Tanacetum cinerariifolium]
MKKKDEAEWLRHSGYKQEIQGAWWLLGSSGKGAGKSWEWWRWAGKWEVGCKRVWREKLVGMNSGPFKMGGRAKDPVFGMPIPMVMLNDEIKASADYLEYLTKSKRGKPAKGRSKGLLTKKGVEVVVEEIATVRVPKKKHTKTVIKQTGQSKVIRSGVQHETDEEALDHSKKLKGVERMSETIKFLLQLRKENKASKRDFILQQRPKGSSEGSGVTLEVPNGLSQKGPNEGSGVTPAVPDEPEDSSSSSYLDSDDEIKDILSDNDDKATEENVEQLTVPHTSSSQTLSLAEYGNQFINDNLDVSLIDVLKEPVEAEVQSLVDIPILQQNLVDQRPPLVDTIVTLIPETTLSLKQPPQSRRKINVLPKKSKKPDTQVDTEVLDIRLTRLEKKVDAMSRFNIPEAINKSVKSYIMKNVLPKGASDFGPEKEKKKRKQKYFESLKNDKDQASSLRKGKSPSKSSKTDKSIHEEEIVHDVEIEARESIKEDVVDAKDPSQVDASTWFNEMVNDEKDPLMFDDVMGSLVDFTKFTKNCLKKDKITKADLEGPTIPHDLSKPLPLHGAPGRLTIPVDFFFNKDLEYLTTGNVEKKYGTSLTKLKFIRYDLKGIKEMIPQQWSSTKRVKDVQLGVESYQTKLNITMPQDDKKYLMRANEVNKFGDGTLKKVRVKLDYMLHNFELGYNDGMPKRS